MSASTGPSRAPLKPDRLIIYTLAVLGLISLTWVSLDAPALFNLPAALVIFLAVLFQIQFPLETLRQELTLSHAITLGAGLLYGLPTSGWASLAGILAGTLLRSKWPASKNYPYFSPRIRWHSALLHTGLTSLALTLGLGIPWANLLVSQNQLVETLVQFILPELVFALTHGGLFLLIFLVNRSPRRVLVRRDLITLGLVELLPLPFIFIVAIAFPFIRDTALAALAGIPSIIGVLLYGLGMARHSLERRISEIELFEKVSAILRSPLNLDHLFEVIQHQVTRVTGVDNFYIALYNAPANRIWYPLAVKNGARQEWSPRPLADRLTDRVIREAKPLSFSTAVSPVLRPGGSSNVSDLPIGETMPRAWLGVPLLTSTQTLGCLALFSTEDEVAFQDADLDLLLILSGQLGVAIENALLYEKAQRRLEQIVMLNQLSNLVSASLDVNQVLQQVCTSVISVSEANFSAIYLLVAGDQVQFANAFGLSESFISANQVISTVKDERTLCLRSRQPVLVPRLAESHLEPTHLEMLKQEGIQAYADFPLVIPGEQPGILTVYYTAEHAFTPEECELLQTFAAQAGQAVANARLYARTDTALSQRANQLSILEAVGRELAAATHSDQLFEMILDFAVRFTNSQWGALSLYDRDNERGVIKASLGYPADFTYFKVNSGINGRSIRRRENINVPDVRLDADYIDLSGGQARSQLSIPLLFEGRVLGGLTLEHADLAAYSPADQSFISQLANQAAIAIANSQLYQETQRVMREQAMLYLVSSQLSSAMELDNAVDTIERALLAALDRVQVGVYLWDSETEYFKLQDRGRGSQIIDLAPQYTLHELGELNTTLGQSTPIQLPAGSQLPTALAPIGADSLLLLFPLAGLGQHLGFVLALLPERSPLEPDEIQLLHAIISQGGIAIQNALLFSDVSYGRDRLAAVLNSVGEGILMIEAGGRITLANDAIYLLTGMVGVNLVGQTLSSLTADQLRRFGYTPLEVSGLLRSFSNPPPTAQVSTTIHLGETTPAHILERTTLPVWGSKNRLIGWMIVLRDVTEEHELAQARETITETLVHDLRSPLSAVSGSFSILDEVLKKSPTDPYLLQAVQIGQRGANRMNNLVDSLLDISRMQSGRMELRLETLDLHALVASTIIDFLPRANEHGILIRNDIPGNIPSVRGDVSKISRVLVNLLDNALKFTPSGGKVMIDASLQPDGQVAIRVQDDGPGIPLEYGEKIFERFIQVPGQRGRQRGSGLGLTFCKLAVETHGGRIWYEPRSSGGSNFTFTLPVASEKT